MKGVPKAESRTVEFKTAFNQDAIASLVALVPDVDRIITKYVRNLRAAGRLRRVGPDKGGHWEVLEGGRR